MSITWFSEMSCDLDKTTQISKLIHNSCISTEENTGDHAILDQSLAIVSPNARPYFVSDDGTFSLFHGDVLDFLPQIAAIQPAELIFTDPPYFLSNGGITCHAGRMVAVHKGAWDRLGSIDQMHDFNKRWLAACQAALTPDGSMWVTGTRHVIYSVGFAMQQLGFKLLNEITWEKPNPPPNLSCRYFTHSTETVLWAAKDKKSKHTFHYQAMRAEAGGKQMKSVWRLTAPAKREKAQGSHPTQKPLALLGRIIQASSNPGDLVIDPFVGSGTTGIAALQHGRRFVGIDLDASYLDLAVSRYQELLRR